MVMTDEKGAGPVTGNELVAQLRASGALDELFAKIGSGEVAVTGTEGLVPALLKTSLERGLKTSIARFLDASPEFSDELRDRLAVALKPGMQDAALTSRDSVVLAA